MAITLTVGGSTAQIGVQNLLLSDFTLTSVDPSVATVNASGVVTPVAAGNVAIRVKRKSNGKEKLVFFRVQDPDKVLIPVINNQIYGAETVVAAPSDPVGYGAGGYGAGGYGA